MKKGLRACVILTLHLICNSIFLSSAQTQTKSPEEQQVLYTLERFKKGIEQGNIETGEQITTEEFYPFFKEFYDSLVSVYSQHRASFPMEVGHLKILRNGRAKYERAPWPRICG